MSKLPYYRSEQREKQFRELLHEFSWKVPLNGRVYAVQALNLDRSRVKLIEWDETMNRPQEKAEPFEKWVTPMLRHLQRHKAARRLKSQA